MLNSPPKTKRWMSWFFVFAWACVLLLSVPIARQVQTWLADHWRESYYALLAVVGVLAATAMGVAGLLRYALRHVWRKLAWLFLAGLVFLYLLLYETATPAEGLHLVEYGALSFLIFRAFSHRVRDPGIYAATVLLTALIGTLDEMLQWAVPGRYWDFRDVRFNAAAAALVQFAIWRGLTPAMISRPIRPATWLLIRRLTLGLGFLICFCIVNTPRFVHWYAARVPLLAPLERTEAVMSEYGYRYRDPEIGTFYSRFPLAELHRLDRERGARIGALLSTQRSWHHYDQLLLAHSAGSDPFFHEFMVHLYRRDHYYGTLHRHEPGGSVYRQHETVVRGETKLLEKIFPVSLAAVRTGLDREVDAAITGFAPPTKLYRSPVSRHLITSGSWVEYLAGCLFLLLLLSMALRHAAGRAARHA